jgi:excisionase family DNA binding protein
MLTPPVPVARLAYSPDEVAQLLGVSRPFVYKMMNSGDLPSLKLGRSRKIRHDDVIALLGRGGGVDAA